MTQAPRKSKNCDIFLIKGPKERYSCRNLVRALFGVALLDQLQVCAAIAAPQEIRFSHLYRFWHIMRASEGYVGNTYHDKRNNIEIFTIRGAEKYVPSAIEMVLNRHKPPPATRSVRIAQIDGRRSRASHLRIGARPQKAVKFFCLQDGVAGKIENLLLARNEKV